MFLKLTKALHELRKNGYNPEKVILSDEHYQKMQEDEKFTPPDQNSKGVFVGQSNIASETNGESKGLMVVAEEDRDTSVVVGWLGSDRKEVKIE